MSMVPPGTGATSFRGCNGGAFTGAMDVTLDRIGATRLNTGVFGVGGFGGCVGGGSGGCATGGVQVGRRMGGRGCEVRA